MTSTSQVRLWTLIGPSKAGKSYSIKNLASREDGGPPGFVDIRLRGGGYLSVLAKVSAWQEDWKTPDQTVTEIRAKVDRRSDVLHGKTPAYVNVLSALRFEPVSNPTTGAVYPHAYEYLSRWITEGWSIESIVLMSPDQQGGLHDFYGAFGAPTAWLYNSREALTRGQMVGAIRNHFEWA